MILDLLKINSEIDTVVQHVLCDLEPDVREPIDILLGRLAAALSVLQADNYRLREHGADARQRVIRSLYEGSAS